MNLYNSIAQRKSCRKYEMQPLPREQMTEIENAIQGFSPLTPAPTLAWRFTQQVKGLYHVAAPHYLIISGQGQPGEKENVGFLFQQLALWLDAQEIGCVWLGESKDTQVASTKGDIITIAFGHTAGPVHRTKEQFKRKPLEQITNSPDDPCIQAVHLAPSGMNTQPWYLEQQNGKVLVYKQKLKLPLSLVYKHSDIDMGIALCHYALACQELGKPFHFSRTDALPGKAGYLPFGIID